MPYSVIRQVKIPGVNDPVAIRDDAASHYLGKTTTALVDGATSATVSIGGNNVTAVANDWVRLNSSNDSFVYTGTAWVQFSAESTYSITPGTGLEFADGTTTLNHSNSVTANTTEGFKTFTFDAEGHITAATNATTAQANAIDSGITSAKVSSYDTHIADTSNPHSVTATQVGLGNLTNDKQIKGLASGTTQGDIVLFGTDGYTVSDSGAGIETTLTASSDKKIPTSKAVATYVASQFSDIDAMIFKGTLGTGGTTTTLPTTGYEAGWTYRVVTAGTYAGKTCEIGDLVICVKDYAQGTASNDDWTVAQTNIDGAVTSSATQTTDGNIPVFDGTSGKTIKNSSVSIETTLTDSSDAKVPTSKAVATYVGTEITSAVEALDVTGATGIAASKTISGWSETDGKVSITTQDISITRSQVSDITTDTIQPVSNVETCLTAINTAAPGSTAPSGTAVSLFSFDSDTGSLVLNQVACASANAVTLGTAKTFLKPSTT